MIFGREQGWMQRIQFAIALTPVKQCERPDWGAHSVSGPSVPLWSHVSASPINPALARRPVIKQQGCS